MLRILQSSFAAITLAAAAITVGGEPAAAQSSYADKAVGRLVGKWVSASKGRIISFQIRDYNAVFEDEIEPGVVLSGAYRQDDAGAGYVLTYSKGFQCRYNISIMSGEEGNQINLRLVSAAGDFPKDRFRCIEGELKRTH